jgi:hypothetical protein
MADSFFGFDLNVRLEDDDDSNNVFDLNEPAEDDDHGNGTTFSSLVHI